MKLRTCWAYALAACAVYVALAWARAPMSFPGYGLGWWLVGVTAISVAYATAMHMRQRLTLGVWGPAVLLSRTVSCWLVCAAASSVLFTTSLTGMAAIVWSVVAIPATVFGTLLLRARIPWWGLALNVLSILPGVLVGGAALGQAGDLRVPAGDPSAAYAAFTVLAGWLLLDLALLLTVATVRARFAAQPR